MKTNLLEILSSNEIKQVHDATLDVLERTGVLVKSDPCLKMLEDGGAVVDRKAKRVKFSPSLVEEMLKKTPSSFTWYARNPDDSIIMEPNQVNFAPGAVMLNVIDPDTEDRRPSILKDVTDLTRLVDAMPNVAEGFCMVHPNDVPDGAAHAYMALEMAKNTEKPFRGRGKGSVIARDLCLMHSVLAGGDDELRKKPNLYVHINPVSPLTHDKDQLDALMEYAKYNIPLGIAPQTQAGGTGPVTLAGTLVQMNAEVLSGITILEMINPHNPAAYCCVASVLDPRGGAFRYGAIEMGLFGAAAAQMARFYNIPVRGSAGGTDACLPDMQAGYETGMNLLLAALSGINLIAYSVGTMEQALTISYSKTVIDNEIIGNVKRAAQGIEVNDETLAVDLIDKVGPGGHYMAEKHTRKYHTTEHFIPELATCLRWDSWKQAGSRSIEDIAREKAKRILKEHHPPPLDRDVEKRLEQIVHEVTKRVTS